MQPLTDILTDQDKKEITELLIETVAGYHRDYNRRAHAQMTFDQAALPDYAITDRMRDIAAVWNHLGRHCYPDDRVTVVIGLYDVGSHFVISAEHMRALGGTGYKDSCRWYVISRPVYQEYGTNRTIKHPWQVEEVYFDSALEWLNKRGAITVGAIAA